MGTEVDLVLAVLWASLHSLALPRSPVWPQASLVWLAVRMWKVQTVALVALVASQQKLSFSYSIDSRILQWLGPMSKRMVASMARKLAASGGSHVGESYYDDESTLG